MTEWDAAEYARRSSLQETMAREVLALLDLDDSERILDVGCGEGKVTGQIAACAPNASVVGVDPSHDMISFAQAHHILPNLRFQVADARSLPFQDEFDLVVSFNALHWVPDQQSALRSIYNALINGGKAQLRLVPAGPRKSVETIVEETRRTPKWKAYFADFNDPYLRLTSEEYAALARHTGFRVLRVFTKDHSWDFGSRSAFAGFCAVGCVAWTNRLPAPERMNFINEVLERYQEGADSQHTFKFYQMDIGFEKS
jgi:trans-aconitate 2-methyltransferase